MITLIITLIVIGLALYLIGPVPMDPRTLLAIRGLVLLCTVLYILSAFGIISRTDFPHLR